MGVLAGRVNSGLLSLGATDKHILAIAQRPFGFLEIRTRLMQKRVPLAATRSDQMNWLLKYFVKTVY